MARTRQRGFTLAEVLVALALMALLATISWRGVTSMAQAKQSADARVEETLRLGTVMAQWEQDLQQLHDTALLPDSLAFDGATLRLVRRQNTGLQVVAWSLREDKWTRWAAPVANTAQGLQDAWMQSLQLIGNEPGQLLLYDGLTSWQMYFYFNNAWTNAQSSGDVVNAPNPGTGASAPAPSRKRLPDGVRIVLTLAQPGSAESARTITRDILVPPQLP